ATAGYGQSSPTMDHHPQSHESSYGSSVSPMHSSTSLTSPTTSIGPNSSPLRFEVVLEASTAAAQRIDETSLTYLNKGQYYAFQLSDVEKFDGDVTSTIRIMFYEDAHRKLAKTYWNCWLTQHTYPKTARAIDIGMLITSTLHYPINRKMDNYQRR